MRSFLLLFALIASCRTQPIESFSPDLACPNPVMCPGGPLLYCCPPGAHCEPPSCGVPADAAAPLDLGPCPEGQYLLVPCCGGFNDESCSNGPGPPPPFCTVLPSSCEGQSACSVGGCEGALDQSQRTLGCICI